MKISCISKTIFLTFGLSSLVFMFVRVEGKGRTIKRGLDELRKNAFESTVEIHNNLIHPSKNGRNPERKMRNSSSSSSSSSSSDLRKESLHKRHSSHKNVEHKPRTSQKDSAKSIRSSNSHHHDHNHPRPKRKSSQSRQNSRNSHTTSSIYRTTSGDDFKYGDVTSTITFMKSGSNSGFSAMSSMSMSSNSAGSLSRGSVDEVVDIRVRSSVDKDESEEMSSDMDELEKNYQEFMKHGDDEMFKAHMKLVQAAFEDEDEDEDEDEVDVVHENEARVE